MVVALMARAGGAKGMGEEEMEVVVMGVPLVVAASTGAMAATVERPARIC